MRTIDLIADDLALVVDGVPPWIEAWLASLVADLETLVAFENFCLAREGRQAQSFS